MEWIIISSGNGLAPVWRQAITWSSKDLSSIRPLETNLNDILTAPSHYLNLCWLIMSKDFWYSSQHNSQEILMINLLDHEFEIYYLKITAPSPRRQWVNVRNWNKPQFLTCCWLEWTGMTGYCDSFHDGARDHSGYGLSQCCYNEKSSLIGWANTQNDPWVLNSWTHSSLIKMANTLQKFPKGFSLMKNLAFSFNFHWDQFIRV